MFLSWAECCWEHGRGLTSSLQETHQKSNVNHSAGRSTISSFVLKLPVQVGYLRWSGVPVWTAQQCRVYKDCKFNHNTGAPLSNISCPSSGTTHDFSPQRHMSNHTGTCGPASVQQLRVSVFSKGLAEGGRGCGCGPRSSWHILSH